MFIWFDTKRLYDDSINQAKSLIRADIWNGYADDQPIPLDQANDLAIQALSQ